MQAKMRRLMAKSILSRWLLVLGATARHTHISYRLSIPGDQPKLRQLAAK